MTDDLRARLNDMPTGELVEILQGHDLEQWRPEVFPLVEAILRERHVDVAAVKMSVPHPVEDETEFESLESVESFSAVLPANLCRMALQEAGIEAWLSTEHLAGVAPPLGFTLGVDVLVRPASAAAARAVIASLQDGTAAIPEEPEPCPRCQSLENERVPEEDAEPSVLAWARHGPPPAQSIWRRRCKSCGHEWE